MIFTHGKGRPFPLPSIFYLPFLLLLSGIYIYYIHYIDFACLFSRSLYTNSRLQSNDARRTPAYNNNNRQDLVNLSGDIDTLSRKEFAFYEASTIVNCRLINRASASVLIALLTFMHTYVIHRPRHAYNRLLLHRRCSTNTRR